MARRRRRRSRRRTYRRRRRNPLDKGTLKQLAYGAGGGALAGLLLTAGAGAARGLPAGEAMPKNALFGGAFGALAGVLAGTPARAAILGALAAGTGIYVKNVAGAATAPVVEPEGTAGLGAYVTPGSFLSGLGALPAVPFDPLMATRMQLGAYVTPGSFLSGYVDSSNYKPLSEYVTPGSFLEGLGAVFEPSGVRTMPRTMAFRGRLTPAGKCAVC